jgi:MoaA/NifB/PqqE/SkfB family radical SAM enzyme
MIARAARIIYRFLFTPYLTRKRLVNRIVLEIHERLRLDYIRAYPDTLIIETTNACNSTCQLCPVGEGRRARPVRCLDMATYCRFVDELAPYAQTVILQNWGEPLLDRYLAERIRYANSKGLKTVLSTNLHRLTVCSAEELVSSGLSVLGVSLHAASAATYELYQPGKSFDLVLDNIRTLVAARERLGRKEPRISLIVVQSRVNEHEITELPKLVQELGVDEVVVSPVSINARFLWSDVKMQDRHLSEEQFRAEVIERARKWLPRKEFRSFDPLVPAAPKLPSCDRLWRYAVLNSDGTVPPCCDVYRLENNFGCYKPGQNFREIWNNDLFRTARRSFRKPGPHETLLICTHCPGHESRAKWRNPMRF